MQRQINNRFQANQGMNSGGYCQMFSEHEFPPIGAQPPTKCAATRSPMTSSQNSSDSGVSTAVSPATNENSPDGVKPTNSWTTSYNANYTSSVPPALNGFGVLTWLSTKAGVITYGDGETIAFQKDAFCDQGVGDFTEILRVGMVLSFHGVVHSAHQYSVARVTPLYGEESRRVFANSGEIVLEPDNTHRIGKDIYSPDLDYMALQVLLEAFLKHGKTRIMFSHFTEHLRNYLGNDDLNDYVGMSSLKRRTFLETRTHLFKWMKDDSVALQYPQVYEALYLLNSYLLRHGGTTSLQDMYDFYLSPLVPPHIKNHIGYDRESFWKMIQRHTFLFAIFPGKAYVSARRNLPPLDFTGFLKQNFPGIEQQIVNGNYHQATTRLPSVMDSQYSVPPPSTHSRQYQNQKYGYQNGGNYNNYNNGYQRVPYQSQHSSHSSRSQDSWRPDAVDETLTLEFGSQLSLNSGNVTGKKIGIGHANCICTCKCGAHHKAVGQENVDPQGSWEKSVSAMLSAKPEELIGAYKKPEPTKSSAELLAKMAAARQVESGFWGNPGESSNSGGFGNIGQRPSTESEKGEDGPSGTYNLFGGSNNLLSLGK